jgi:hypothetical protein
MSVHIVISALLMMTFLPMVTRVHAVVNDYHPTTSHVEVTSLVAVHPVHPVGVACSTALASSKNVPYTAFYAMSTTLVGNHP